MVGSGEDEYRFGLNEKTNFQFYRNRLRIEMVSS